MQSQFKMVVSSAFKTLKLGKLLRAIAKPPDALVEMSFKSNKSITEMFVRFQSEPQISPERLAPV